MADEQAGTEALGPNAWLVDEMYEQFRADPSSVSESWQDFFADYKSDAESVGIHRQDPKAAPDDGGGDVDPPSPVPVGVGGPESTAAVREDQLVV